VDPIDGLVCDLDGVLYRGSERIAGAAEKVAELRAAGVRLVFATNNATATVQMYVERLAALGLQVSSEEVLTSAVVTGEKVRERGLEGATTFLLGLDGIREELTKAGVRFVEGKEARNAELVVTSGDPRFTYESLRTATFALRNGAEFLATNDDLTYPAPDGLWPGAGSILAAVQAASGRTAEVMGKPHKPMMEAAARRLEGCRRIAVVGDQPATDLAGGRAMGWITILVLTGVTSSDDGLDPAPDVSLPSLADLDLRSLPR
jgi:4-nitrophenyl phosphatase